MSRIPALETAHAPARSQELLAGVQKMLGAQPNMFRVAAHAPAALEGIVQMFATTAKGTLSARVREAIALTVAETNGCDYCLSAHAFLGAKAGLSAEQIDAARDASSTDDKTAALLRFACVVVLERGRVSEQALVTLKGAGVSDAELLEVVANVALNVFTNYFNLVVDTDIDFPAVHARR